MLTKYGHRNPALVSCTERATWTVVPSRSTSLSCSASSSPHRRPVARSKVMGWTGGPRLYAHLINKVDRGAADATEKALAPAAQE